MQASKGASQGTGCNTQHTIFKHIIQVELKLSELPPSLQASKGAAKAQAALRKAATALRAIEIEQERLRKQDFKADAQRLMEQEAAAAKEVGFTSIHLDEDRSSVVQLILKV